MSAPEREDSHNVPMTPESSLSWQPVPVMLAGGAYLSWVSGANASDAFLILVSFAIPLTIAILRERSQQFASGSSGDRQRSFLLHGLLPLLLLPLLFLAFSGAGWFEAAFLRSALLVTLATAGLSGLLVSSSIAAAAPAVRTDSLESAESDAARLARRLRFTFGIPAILAILVCFDYSAHSEAEHQNEQRLTWANAAVESISRTSPELSMADRVARALPQESLRPDSVTAFQLGSDGRVAGNSAKIPDVMLAELDRQIGSGLTSGAVQIRGSDVIGAFQVLGDGSTLVVGLPRASVGGLLAGGFASVLMFIAFAGYLIYCVDRISASVGRGVSELEERVSAMAAGHFDSSAKAEGSGDFVSIGKTLQALGDRIGSILDRATSTALAVDSTVGALSSVLSNIGESSASQAIQIAEAHRLMGSMNARVGAAARAADELNQSIDESSNSVLELGAAGDELNDTASVLTSKVDEVSDSLEQMIRSVKEVGSTTDRLAEASEETSSSMEEMASAMRAVDTAAETTANISRDVVDKAEVGQAKVVQTIAGMEAIREATDAAENVIRGLGARTNEIGGILDVIEDVADETNLLALNAAIIAAQAGEQGKAFSVVADEIKELADRVLASTKEIGGLIGAVQEESENAIGAIEAGSSSVMSGVDLSAEAGKTLEEITDASRESGTRIGEIVNSVREQTKAASHVVALMEKVRESADQIGAASAQQDQGNEVVYRSALTMREVAQQVRRTTEDQAAGFGRIRENVIGVRGAVEEITGSLREQSEACTEVESFLDGVAEGSRANEAAARTLRESMIGLSTQAEELREDVERFRG